MSFCHEWDLCPTLGAARGKQEKEPRALEGRSEGDGAQSPGAGPGRGATPSEDRARPRRGFIQGENEKPLKGLREVPFLVTSRRAGWEGQRQVNLRDSLKSPDNGCC